MRTYSYREKGGGKKKKRKKEAKEQTKSGRKETDLRQNITSPAIV